jgi:hypothetical protein
MEARDVQFLCPAAARPANASHELTELYAAAC